eukprot:12671663-Alexandrium_andersonii.AAC.2
MGESTPTRSTPLLRFEVAVSQHLLHGAAHPGRRSSRGQWSPGCPHSEDKSNRCACPHRCPTPMPQQFPPRTRGWNCLLYTSPSPRD